MKKISIICLIWMVGSCVWIQATERPFLPDILPVFEKYVQTSMAEWGVPGAAIAVVKEGKIVYLKGFGVRKLGSQDLIDSHTTFQLASLTKNFTVTLMAQLVDEGKIHWDDRVIHYFPEFSLMDTKATQEFTIRDLLCHRSGLPGFSGDTLWYLGWEADEIINALQKIPPETPFRTTFDYQNMFVGIAGIIIERITHKKYETLLEEHLFHPLNLPDIFVGFPAENKFSLWCWLKSFFSSSSLPARNLRENMAFPHDTYEGKTRLLPLSPHQYTFKSTSGINASIEDMARWMIFHLNNCQIDGSYLVSLQNQQQMRTPLIQALQRENGRQFPKERISHVEYGMGWFIHDYAGIKVLSHMGGMNGTRALITLIPDEQTGIVILSNLGGMRVSFFPEGLRSKFLDLYLGIKDEKDWSHDLWKSFQDHFKKSATKLAELRFKNPAPPFPLTVYEGEYEDPLYGSISVSHENNQLFLKYRDRKIPLEHWNHHMFKVNGWQLGSGFSGTDTGLVKFDTHHSKVISFKITLLKEESPNSAFIRKSRDGT